MFALLYLYVLFYHRLILSNVLMSHIEGENSEQPNNINFIFKLFENMVKLYIVSFIVM